MKEKYVVFKIEDLKELPYIDLMHLAMIGKHYEENRIRKGKSADNVYLCINTDESYAREVIDILKKNNHWEDELILDDNFMLKSATDNKEKFKWELFQGLLPITTFEIAADKIKDDAEYADIVTALNGTVDSLNEINDLIKKQDQHNAYRLQPHVEKLFESNVTITNKEDLENLLKVENDVN